MFLRKVVASCLSGLILSTSISAFAADQRVVPVDIIQHLNNDGVAFKTNPADGSLNGGGYKYPAEMFPEDGIVNYGGIIFRIKGLEDGKMNNISCKGEKIELSEGKYEYIYLAGASTNGSFTGEFNVIYADGKVERVEVGLTDWCWSLPFFDEGIILASDYRYDNHGESPPACFIFVQSIKLNPERSVKSLVLPNEPNMHIFAITLASGIKLAFPPKPIISEITALKERRGKRITSFQTNMPYVPGISLKTDVVAVHMHGMDIKRPIASWEKIGYEVHRMFFCGSDAGKIYVDGGWDGKTHWDEVETRRDGSYIMVADARPYMVPSSNWARYVEETLIRPAIDAGAAAIWPEEPLAHTAAGYGGYFKEAWAAFYNEPWQAPHSSVNNFWRASKLSAELYHRLIERLGNYTKTYAESQGREVKYIVPVHSLISYAAGHMLFSHGRMINLDSVDGVIGQVWTGPIRWSLGTYEGLRDTSFFESAYALYSYFRNLAKGMGKELHFLVDPKEDDPGYDWLDYEKWYEETVLAMLFFPDVYRYEVVPWPDRIFPGGPFPPAPADYRMQLLHNFAAFQDMHNQTEIKWDTGTRGIGVLVSDTLGWQQGGPAGSTMDSFHGLFLPLIKRGIPAEIVPIERIGDAGYLDEFKVLLLSYDMWKPLYEVYHQYLRDWVKEGGVLLFFGGADEYNKVQEWWRESGYERPQDHLLESLGIKIESAKELTTPTVPGMHVLKAGIENNLTRKLVKLGVAPKFAEEGLIIPGGEEEVPYLYEVCGSGGSWRGVRFADKYGYFTYQFILPGVRAASVELITGNNYLVKISGDMRTWTEVLRAEPEYAEGDVALKNLGPRTINLTPHIGKNGVVYLRFLDASTHDGWGSYLARVDLKIEGEVKKPESLPGDSFGISQRYTLMGYKTSDTVSLFSTQEGYKVIWEKELGRGAFIYAGVPSKFFAHHRNNAQVLRELVRYACEKGGILYEEQHYVKLRRGKYAIVRALDGAVSVPGKYLNLFGYDLPVVIDPSFLPGQGGLLYDISGYSDYDVPRILFSSLRLVQKNETRETTSFTIHSAQGTTAVCRIYGGKHFPKSIKAYQQNQPWPVDSIWNSDTKTLLIKFDGHVGGIKVEINWSEQKKGI